KNLLASHMTTLRILKMCTWLLNTTLLRSNNSRSTSLNIRLGLLNAREEVISLGATALCRPHQRTAELTMVIIFSRPLHGLHVSNRM
ncbi:MAG: hypothetical protein ACREA9_29835, partial [Pyrinomonadaceae bacterium]